MKKQVIFLNGWAPKENFQDYYQMLQKLDYNPYQENFKNYNKTLWEYLGEEYEYLRAPFHDSDFADYQAWKIMFEKMIPYLNQEIILVATSLGGSFIFKYLWENLFPLKISKLFLLAPAIEDTPDEILGSFHFDFETAVQAVKRSAEIIYIYHSSDDTIVPLEQSEKIHAALSESIFRKFSGRGHWYLESRIPELEKDIKS